ncbi:hypothetical protein K474DRAFT_1659558 [Panus rudis PR-1116 ss-1]|nr:hypothetical protein K474DRAFT_1659558 [Panus rudis PR-1116 ss-1]
MSDSVSRKGVPQGDRGPQTPIKNRILPYIRSCLKAFKVDDAYPDIADEVMGEAIGPMPLHLFYACFMDTARLAPRSELEACVEEGMFDNVRPDDPKHQEKDMYHPIIAQLKAHGLCAKFILRDTSNKTQKGAGTKQRPDLTIYLLGEEGEELEVGLVWDNVEACGEVKDDSHLDPHRHTFQRDEVLENIDNDASQKVFGQLLSYVSFQLLRQHRNYTFAIGIYGDYFRIYRIDRSGVVVSEQINYKKNPLALAEFFWRYNQLSRTERGFDPSVVKATAEEAELLTQAAEAHTTLVEEDSDKVRDYPGLKSTTDKNLPAYKVIVSDADDNVKTYVVRRSLLNKLSPLGCATRGFFGVEVPIDNAAGKQGGKPSKLVFIKDTWRVDGDDADIENVVYADLAAHGVPHLPVVICGGDVCWEFVENDAGEVVGMQKNSDGVQETITQLLANASKKDVPWRRSCNSLRTLVHNRTVFELLYPIESVRDAKELVQVVRDLMKTAIDSYVETGRANRDIHIDNTMVSAAGRGVLIDWGHSRLLHQKRKPGIYRTGSWQFMSYALLKNRNKAHSIFDDLESIFWIFLYVALRHFHHVTSDDFTPTIFDYKEGKTGGLVKFDYLRNTNGKKITFSCPALDQAVDTMRTFWQSCYRDDVSKRHTKTASKSSRQRAKEIPPSLLNTFDKALRLEEESWTHGDWIEDQYRPVSDTARRKKNRKALESTLVNGSSIREKMAKSVLQSTSVSTTRVKRSREGVDEDAGTGAGTTLVDKLKRATKKARVGLKDPKDTVPIGWFQH